MYIKYGEPTHKLTRADIANSQLNIQTFLEGKTGIYTLKIRNSNYTGHVDLIINGKFLGDSGITEIGKIEAIEIWQLN